jgi:hypothetical protein
LKKHFDLVGNARMIVEAGDLWGNNPLLPPQRFGKMNHNLAPDIESGAFAWVVNLVPSIRPMGAGTRFIR